MKQRVVVGLSGGVDSSVAAYLLLQQGYEVIGMFMKNWHDESVTLNNECPWVEDSNDALLVAQKLGIPFQTLDLSAQYKERIVDYMFAEYEAGRTPNPDILCNREIKFDIFLKAARQLKADYVATGHYARREVTESGGKIIYRLLAGMDASKDQSYFLCQLTQAQLAQALFPVGELTKPEVRNIARELGLVTADKKDSQGLCFVGKIRLPDFLQQQLKPRAGRIIEIPADSPLYLEPELAGASSLENKLLQAAKAVHYSPRDGLYAGEHNGAHFYTIGQRKGLRVGGKAEPLFVLATDVEQNAVYVGMGEQHPGLYRQALFIAAQDVHWLREDLAIAPGQSMRLRARIRYRQPLQDATLYMTAQGAYLYFEQKQKGITPGQFAAWYVQDELIGSGVIA